MRRRNYNININFCFNFANNRKDIDFVFVIRFQIFMFLLFFINIPLFKHDCFNYSLILSYYIIAFIYIILYMSRIPSTYDGNLILGHHLITISSYFRM